MRVFVVAARITPFYPLLPRQRSRYTDLYMKPNIGTADRILRLVFAILLAGLAIQADSTLWRVVFALGSLFCVYQALTSWCVLYALMGKNTCPLPPQK